MKQYNQFKTGGLCSDVQKHLSVYGAHVCVRVGKQIPLLLVENWLAIIYNAHIASIMDEKCFADNNKYGLENSKTQSNPSILFFLAIFTTNLKTNKIYYLEEGNRSWLPWFSSHDPVVSFRIFKWIKSCRRCLWYIFSPKNSVINQSRC